ncbi:hypothetical protein BX666DRAFT_1901591, partial [Dichotomocladium elegans]
MQNIAIISPNDPLRDILAEHPKLIMETTTQTITNAYMRRTDIGDHPPVAPRDYRRSPKDRALITEEVTKRLAERC